MSDKRKPIGIKLDNCENVILTDNKGYGDIDLIVAQNSKNIRGSDNELINHNNSDNSGDNWYQKPMGTIGITVVAGVVLSAVIWLINHYSGLGLG